MRRVNIRFAESDCVKIAAQASAENLTVSEYVRKVVLAARAMTEGEEILLAEIMRNRELLMRLGDTDAGARAARQDIQEQVELVPPAALVGRAMSLRSRAQRKAG
jgi:mobilization protein NikA